MIHLLRARLGGASSHNMSARRGIGVVIVGMSLAGCVTNDPPPPAEGGALDMSGGEDLTSLQEDLARDLSPGQDDGTDLRDTTQEMGVDMTAQMICAPSSRECVDDQTPRQCSDDGLRWDTQACAEGDICTQGECTTAPICTPGEATCVDSTSRQVCRPGGMMFATESCLEGSSCVRGECRAGLTNGSICQAHEDCAGGRCHCGAQTGEGCSDPFASPAYCTDSCATNEECASSEWCLSSDIHLISGQASNYNHCVPRCQGVCGDGAFACVDLPVVHDAGQVTWEEGCYFKGVKEIGQECDADVECLGGYCLKDYFSTGYCSLRCEESACPGDAACVKLRDDEYWCTLKCSDGLSSSGVCPLDEPTDRLDVTCAFRQERTGNNARVCISTSS